MEMEEPLPSNGRKFKGRKANGGSHLPGIDEVKRLQRVGQPEVGQGFQLGSEL